MDLEHLFAERLRGTIPTLLSDQTVKAIDLYHLAPGSPADGGALLSRWDKTKAGNAEAAIVYLLQSFLGTIRTAANDGTFTDGEQFLRLLKEEKILPGTIGTVMDPKEAFAFYQWLHNAVVDNATSEFKVNGEKVKPAVLMREVDMQRVLAFCNDWNEKLFLFESRDAWWLLSWFTDV